MIFSGRLRSLEPKLQAVLHDVFGHSAKLRPMVRPVRESPTKSVVIRGLPISHEHDVILSKLKEEYPSASTIIDLRKATSTSPFRSVKVVLYDVNEWRNLLTHGLRFGWDFFRAEEWIPAPIQCFKCQRFNHKAAVCSGSSRCVTCGGSHAPDKNCSLPVKCANCNGEHKASDNSCPSRQQIILDRQSQQSSAFA